MDNEIDELARWTAEVMNILHSIDYEEMAARIEKRQLIIDRIQAKPLSEQTRERYRDRMMEILRHDEAIMNRLHELKNEAIGGTRKINSVRQQKNAYQTGYSLDGVFFDKRK